MSDDELAQRLEKAINNRGVRKVATETDTYPARVQPPLRLGTSSWSNKDWVGPFYPPGTQPPDFITEYAKHFDTVEVDSTFYGTPGASTVEAWRRRTPDDFVFALKAPQVITHEKLLQDCQTELGDFLSVVRLLGDKCGPILFQFPYFNRRRFRESDPFLDRLEPFLDLLPGDQEFVVEIRNKTWINERLLGILRQKHVALALIDHPWMYPIPYLMRRIDVVTAPFTYVRWLGDRYGIEEKTKTWDKIIVDRSREITGWVTQLSRVVHRGTRVYGYFNNHYAGHAPASIELFRRIWDRLTESPPSALESP